MLSFFSFRYINCAVYGMNTSQKATTKYTPFFLMYFREARRQSFLNAMHEDSEEVFPSKCEDDQRIDDDIKASMEICKKVSTNIFILQRFDHK